MTRAKPIDIPHTVPELMALVREFEAELSKRRSQKAKAQARWRMKRRQQRPIPAETEGDMA